MNFIFLQAEGVAQRGGNTWSFWVVMISVFAAVYFFVIRPQNKRQKKQEQVRQNSMQKGDYVVTSGGLYGYVDDIKDNVIVIVVGTGVRIEVDKASVYLSKSKTTEQDIVCQEKKCPNPQCNMTGIPYDAKYCPKCGSKL